MCDTVSEAQDLAAYLDRFIFPLDQVEVTDESSLFVTTVLVGPDTVITPKLLEQWLSIPFPTIGAKALSLPNGVTVLPGNDLIPTASLQEEAECGSYIDHMGGFFGYTVIRPLSLNLSPLPFPVETLSGDSAARQWEALRCQTGRFSVKLDAQSVNASALELGLMNTLHFRKGCYVGNEVVSKQVATKAVRKRLVGFVGTTTTTTTTTTTVEKGDILELASGPDAGDEVGTITSPSVGGVSLGFMKTKLVESLGNDPQVLLRVRDRDSRNLIVPVRLPYPRFDAARSSRAPPPDKPNTVGRQILMPKSLLTDRSNENENEIESAEEKRKREKLAAMAAKVAALQAKKQQQQKQ